MTKCQHLNLQGHLALKCKRSGKKKGGKRELSLKHYQPNNTRKRTSWPCNNVLSEGTSSLQALSLEMKQCVLFFSVLVLAHPVSPRLPNSLRSCHTKKIYIHEVKLTNLDCMAAMWTKQKRPCVLFKNSCWLSPIGYHSGHTALPWCLTTGF